MERLLQYDGITTQEADRMYYGNIKKDDIADGASYISLMQKNYDVLETALN